MAFIVFEGGDGSGKSTQIKRLSGRLLRREHPYIITREPGGTPLGEQLRKILKTRTDLSPLGELLLFVAARQQLLTQIIEPAIRSGKNIISDRFTASTIAYQGYGRGLDIANIISLNKLVTGEIEPDLNILLDLAPEVALSRISERKKDSFDNSELSFHKRVRQGFIDQAQSNKSKWLVLDANLPAQQLSIEIWHKVKTLL